MAAVHKNVAHDGGRTKLPLSQSSEAAIEMDTINWDVIDAEFSTPSIFTFVWEKKKKTRKLLTCFRFY